MKKNSIIIALFLSLNLFSYAQNVEQITQKQVTEINNKMSSREYNLPSGFPHQRKIYINSYEIGNKIYKIGDEFEVGDMKTNDKITINSDLLGTDLTTGAYSTLYIHSGIYITQLPSAAKGKKIKIKNIILKKIGIAKYWILFVNFSIENIKTPKGTNYCCSDLGASLNSGELIDPEIGEILTREKAIKKLKEAKNLLDLEIISRDKYDSLKTKLTPIIIEDQL